jgi:hypothetical protein
MSQLRADIFSPARTVIADRDVEVRAVEADAHAEGARLARA